MIDVGLKSPLLRQSLVLVISGTLAMSVPFTLINFWTSYRKESSRQQQQLEAFTALFGAQLGKAVWDFDDKSLKQILSGMRHFPSIQRAEIIAPDIHETYIKFRTDSSHAGVAQEYPLFAPDGRHKIGKMVLNLDKASLRNTIRRESTWFIFVLGMELLAVVGLVFTLLKRSVTIPVLNLSRHVQGLGVETLDRPAPVPKTAPPNEIHELAFGVTRLQYEIRDQLIQRKQAEEERQRLDKLVNQAQKLEAIEVLVAGVAHNMNNILTAIMSATSYRKTSATDPEDIKTYQIIGSASKRGHEIVRSLMKFARPTISNQAPFELHALIDEVAVLLQEAKRLPITIVKQLHPEPLWIMGDSGSIHGAIMNLGLNSIDAMPDGGTLTIRTVVRGNQIEFSIQDDGIGMSAETLSRVMEPFFTTKPIGKGTGLGLSMTHGAIKAHGWHMDISSAPNKGTTIKILIPRVQAAIEETPISATAPTGGAVRNILLVDDDDDVRFLVTRLLVRAGQNVISVASGEDALNHLRNNSIPDLVIMDQNMPGLSGIQTLEKIEEMGLEIPILISSGQPDIQIHPTLQKPYVAVICKPFGVDEMLLKLDQIRSHKEVQPPPETNGP